MAEKHRMTPDEVVSYLLEGDGVDYVRVSLRWMVEQLMEAEVSELIGAERGERTEDRATHRNGYRPRRWDTRAGELELAIPKLRKGSYFPSFLAPRKRSEQALVAVVQEAYVAGVSTRKVDQVVESLGLRVSKSEVSRLCEGLDEQVEAFRDRPLEGRYPYLFLDAKRVEPRPVRPAGHAGAPFELVAAVGLPTIAVLAFRLATDTSRREVHSLGHQLHLLASAGFARKSWSSERAFNERLYCSTGVG